MEIRRIDTAWFVGIGSQSDASAEERAEVALSGRDGVIPTTEFKIGDAHYTYFSGGGVQVATRVGRCGKTAVLESIGAALELAELAEEIVALHYDMMVAHDLGSYEYGLELLETDWGRYCEARERLHRLTSQQFFPLTDLIQGYIADFHKIAPPKPPRRINGYVYILRSDSGYWKIGRAKKPGDRLKTFHVKLPMVVSYEMVIPSTDYVALEQELHARFDYCRANGEWFELTDGDIADLKREFENVAEKFNE